MSALDQALPETPPGIDSDVLSQINTLFAQPVPQRTSPPKISEQAAATKMHDIIVVSPPAHRRPPPSLVLLDTMYGDSRPIPHPFDIPQVTCIPRRSSSTVSAATKRAIAKSAKSAKRANKKIVDEEDEGIWHEQDKLARSSLNPLPPKPIALNPAKRRSRSKSAQRPIDCQAPQASPPQFFPPTHATTVVN